MKVIPPNFGYVEEGIFRCGAPEPRHYGFLASLGLRTCILLTDIHDDAFVHWLQESGVTIFCPLVSESQTRGSALLRGAAPAYHAAAAIAESGAGGGAPDRRSRGGAPGGGANGSAVDDATPGGLTSSTLEGRRAFTGMSSVDNMSMADVDGSPDGFVDERTGTSGGGGVDRAGSALRRGPGGGAAGSTAGAGGLAGGASSGGASAAAAVAGASLSAGTSNAARFLQQNVAERQSSSKFSPVFIPEPLYFPANGGDGGGGRGIGGGGGYDGAVPSYEGKLHGLMTLSEAVVVSILHLLLDPQYYPLLITCSKGRYRSGIVCGCLRKLQGWNLVSILEEYRRFAGNKSRADNEEFIELFDEELVSLELSDGRRPTILYNS